jgi:hypothetical protein
MTLPLVGIILMVLAVFSFVLGALTVPPNPSGRPNWQCLGLAFMAAALLFWRG